MTARRAGVGLCAALTSVVMSSCGVGPQERPQLLRAQDAPAGALASPSPAVSGAARVLVYLVNDGVLVAVSRAVPPAPTAQTVLQALLAGPTRREKDAGLVSAVPPSVVLAAGVTGVVHVDVPPRDSASAGRTDEILGYAQIVLTLTTLRAVTGVEFDRDGKPLPVPRSDGSLTPGPLTRRDYVALL